MVEGNKLHFIISCRPVPLLVNEGGILLGPIEVQNNLYYTSLRTCLSVLGCKLLASHHTPSLWV